jgi:hypothetical protein
MGVKSDTWLCCDLSPGMFDCEVGVQGQQFDGSAYGLFAPADHVDVGAETLTRGACVPGLVRVDIIDRKDNLVLVKLPRQTLQAGAYITVTADQLETRPQRQKV